MQSTAQVCSNSCRRVLGGFVAPPAELESLGGTPSRRAPLGAGAAVSALALFAALLFAGCSSVESVTAGGRYNPLTGESGGEVTVRVRAKSDGKSIKPLSAVKTFRDRGTGSAIVSGGNPLALPTLFHGAAVIVPPLAAAIPFRTTRQMPLRPLPAPAAEPDAPRVLVHHGPDFQRIVGSNPTPATPLVVTR